MMVRNWPLRSYVLRSILCIGCTARESLTLLITLPLFPCETIVNCHFEWFQIHGFGCSKVWFVVVLIPLNLPMHASQSKCFHGFTRFVEGFSHSSCNQWLHSSSLQFGRHQVYLHLGILPWRCWAAPLLLPQTPVSKPPERPHYWRDRLWLLCGLRLRGCCQRPFCRQILDSAKLTREIDDIVWFRR